MPNGRQIERGNRTFQCQGVCLIVFEDCFWWGLAIRLCDWSKVLVLEHDLERVASCPVSQAAVRHLGDKLQAVARPSTTHGLTGLSCVVGSGSGRFLAEYFGSGKVFDPKSIGPQPSGLLVCTDAGRRPPEVSPFRWTVLRHSRVGGATTKRLWMASLSYQEGLVIPEGVTRTIGHFIDHGVRPQPSMATPAFTHYKTSDRLLLTKEGVLVPLVYATNYSVTGFGTRVLTPKELGFTLDLPVWLARDEAAVARIIESLDFDTVLPLKFLIAGLDAQQVLIPTERAGQRAPPASGGITAGAAAVVDQGDWLPGLARWLAPCWANQAFVSDQAAKADDARVETGMWDLRITSLLGGDLATLNVLRVFGRRCWDRNVATSFRRHMRSTYGLDWATQLVKLRQQGGELKGDDKGNVAREWSPRDLDFLKDASAGVEVMHQVLGGDWWDWSNGSSLLFWRWSTPFQIQCARDGIPIHVRGKLPRNRKPQRPIPSALRPLYVEKLNKVRERGYIRPGKVVSLTHMFDVPKGDSDIRMVYDGTSSGLNEALWAPSFWLPSTESAMRMYDYSTFCVDLDLGEMFLNFPMDPAIRPYAGVDLTQLGSSLTTSPPGHEVRTSTERKAWWESWTRMFMGMAPSPYIAVRHYYWGEELFRGPPDLTTNPFRYDRVILNLPGLADSSYDPTRPRVMKWCDLLSRIAGDLAAYIDDLRAAGASREHVWQVARRAASILQYLGIQDAPRKRRPPSQQPGAWAGGVHRITEETISRTVTQDKWDKARGYSRELVDAFILCPKGERPTFDHKELERKRGFLIHLAITFPSIVPYLKGIHLTLDSWRPKRGADGWKMKDKVWKAYVASITVEGEIPEAVLASWTRGAPKRVSAAERLEDDAKAIWRLFSSEAPPEVPVRVRSVLVAIYGFGDASGTGFGSTIQRGEGIGYRIGVWSEPETDDESSNWREFTNVVEALEEEAESGALSMTEVYFFTDNTTVESAIFKGTSSSPKLLDLVIRVRLLEMKWSIRLHVIHVAGTRMIAQGSDGVSRGALNEGVMSGQEMLSFVPLAHTALERSPHLYQWLVSWIGPQAELLSPMDWFGKGHDVIGWRPPTPDDILHRPLIKKGVYIWAPPPAAADVAIEELRKARIKRQESTHVFVCPRLFTTRWLRQLYKASDVLFDLSPGKEHWPKHMYEPLLIGISFPFIRMWCPGCYTSDPNVTFPIAQAKEDAEDEDRLGVPEAWFRKSGDVNRYGYAREGDHLMTAFECDFCIFRKLKVGGGEPNPRSETDSLLMAHIRRMNLDAFWSREPSTVQRHAAVIRQGLEASRLFGTITPYVAMGPFPDHDHCGYGVALQMLHASRKPGRYSATSTQWETIRKIKTAASNLRRAGCDANSTAVAVAGSDGKTFQFLEEDPVHSLWFQRFQKGCKSRMGQDWRPNSAVTPGIMRELLKWVMEQARGSEERLERDRWEIAGAYFAICYAISLRGDEGLLLDLEGLREHWDEDPDEYTVIALRGRFKAERNERRHRVPCVNTTGSGVEVRRWIRRLIRIHQRAGRVTGPAVARADGTVWSTSELNEVFLQGLTAVFETETQLFGRDVRTSADIRAKFHVYRSLRRGSNTRAIEMEVAQADINVVNRWAQDERAGHQRTAFKTMSEHYTEVRSLLGPFLRYTHAM